MFSKKKLRFLVITTAIIVIAAAGVPLGFYISSEIRMQQATEAMFYCLALDMDVATDEKLSSSPDWPDFDEYPTAFMRVEYVMDYPPKSKFNWAVIYAKPHDDGVEYKTLEDKMNKENGIADGLGTQGAVDTLNKFITNDPTIKVDRSLTMPLTVRQTVTNPSSVLKIIKQLDREQWDELFGERKIFTAIFIAKRAGIEVPAEQ